MTTRLGLDKTQIRVTKYDLRLLRELGLLREVRELTATAKLFHQRTYRSNFRWAYFFNRVTA
ncbi:MAG: hypothetical protein ACI9O6_003187 [Glaciecola sp.]|jgi:hypothetical protein